MFAQIGIFLMSGFFFLVKYLLIAVAVAIVYFVPTVIALGKKHDKRVWLFWLNVLLGWTVIGWVVVLLLALHIIKWPEPATKKRQIR